MGMFFQYKNCMTASPSNIDAKAPDPKNWKLLEYHKIGPYLIILINYPNCNNFEGKKILVYENCTLDDLVKQKDIDPHFSNDNTKFSPIARFKPNTDGIRNAVFFAMMMHGID